jgi:hypothetical protein
VALLAWVVAQQEEAPNELAALRLAHFYPDAPLFDLLVNGRLRLRDLAFTELSAYITLSAGEYELRVQPHRAPASGETQSVQAPEPFIMTVTLEPGRYYTLVSSGFFDPPPAQDELGALQLGMSAGTTAVVTGPRAYSSTVTEAGTLSELFPGSYSVTASREGFQTATYEVEVRANETAFVFIALQANDSGESSEEVRPTSSSTPGPEWRKVQLQLYEDDLTFPPPGAALVRVIHASPITPTVSVALQRREQENAAPLITTLSYPNEAEYLAVPTGRVNFQLLDGETTQVVTELEDLELQAGTVYTFYIVATRNDSFVSVIPTVDAVLAGQP